MSVIGGSVISGVTEALTQKLADACGKWLKDLMKNSQPKAIERAKMNAAAYLDIMARRLQSLEKEAIEAIETAKQATNDAAAAKEKATEAEKTLHRIRDTMEDPGFSIRFRSSLIYAAGTDNDDIHAVLARLLVARIASSEEDIIPIVVTQACEAVKAMPPEHLRFLAYLAWVRYVLPRRKIPFDNAKQATREILTTCWKFLPRRELYRYDMIHLVSISCITPDDIERSVQVFNNSLKGTEHFLGDTIEPEGGSWMAMHVRRTGGTLDATRFSSLDREDARSVLVRLERWMSHTLGEDTMSLYPRMSLVGLLLGVCVIDQLSGSETDLEQILAEICPFSIPGRSGPWNSRDVYEQAVVKTVAGFFRRNSILSPQQRSPARESRRSPRRTERRQENRAARIA